MNLTLLSEFYFIAVMYFGLFQTKLLLVAITKYMQDMSSGSSISICLTAPL